MILNNPFGHSQEPDFWLFHGSPTTINDRFMASGTYFTEDIEIAKQYGGVVYSIQMTPELHRIMQLDSLKEHRVNARAIPLGMFDVRFFDFLPPA